MQINTRSKTPLKLSVREMRLLSDASKLIDDLCSASEMVCWLKTHDAAVETSTCMEVLIEALRSDSHGSEKKEPVAVG